MKIKTETRRLTLALRLWRGGWDAGYEPDCLDDLETDFPRNRPRDEETDDLLATDQEVNGLIAWWRVECDYANAGDHYGDGLRCLSQTERENGDEWALIVDESPLQT